MAQLFSNHQHDRDECTHDPKTTIPARRKTIVAKTLGANLLTVEGKQHGVALIGGNACVNDIAADYLINLKLPADGATCTLSQS